LLENPHQFSFRGWADFCGLAFHLVQTPRALTLPDSDSAVIEISL
jgi:hypothetical protein